MNKKFFIYISAALAVLLIIGLGWFFASQKQNRTSQTPQSADIPDFQSNQKLTAEKLNIIGEKNNDDLSGASANPTNTNDFSLAGLNENTQKLIQKYLAAIKSSPKTNPTSSSSNGANIATPTDNLTATTIAPFKIISLLSPQASPKKQMTEEEIFDILYPQFYRDYLSDMQDLMVAQDHLRPDQKTDFDTKEKIYSFWKTNVDFWISAGAIDSNQKNNYLTGLDELEALNEMEADMYRQLSLGKIIRQLTRAVANLFKPTSAKAVDVCVEPLYGYRIPIGTSAIAVMDPTGYNLRAPCCKCKAYNQEIGCLNRLCSDNPAVIFDQTTGICGCSGM